MPADRILTLDSALGRIDFAELGKGIFTSGQRLSASWALLESKSISTAVTSVTFSGLDGDTDEIYILSGRIKNGTASSCRYEIRPNGITTNQNTAIAEFTGSAINHLDIGALVMARETFGSGTVLFFNTIHARKAEGGNALERYVRVRSSFRSGAATVYGDIMAGIWDETATNITSLDIVATVASGIGAGSRIALFRIHST